jgi:predicted TIM-barrel fold metal-dependent hydrolase
MSWPKMSPGEHLPAERFEKMLEESFAFPGERRQPSRRDMLAMLSAAGAGIFLSRTRAAAQTVEMAPHFIDTHHHIYPPKFMAENVEHKIDGAAIGWTPRYSLDQMDQNGVATAIGSITNPGVWFGDNAEGRKNARECNEYGAKLAQDYRGRFGMFAALPLPDTEGSLREIEYAFDMLKLDGVGLLTSYDNGKLLGHAQFAPVFDELNRRKAVVFVHPTITCCANLNQRVTPLSIEFPTDTARTITDLVYSGTLMRCPDIRFIFSHGGGTVLMLISRLAGNGLKPEDRAKIIPNGFGAELKKLYYDVASVAVNPAAMAAIFKAIPTSQILFGSDLPFWKIETIASATNQFDLPPSDLRAIQRENALRLLPKLRT